MAQSDVPPQLCRTHISPSQIEERQGQKQMHSRTRTTKLHFNSFRQSDEL